MRIENSLENTEIYIELAPMIILAHDTVTRLKVKNFVARIRQLTKPNPLEDLQSPGIPPSQSNEASERHLWR